MSRDFLDLLAEQLITEGYERLALPPAFIKFTGLREADALLNDIDNNPHAFVIACVMDQQMKAEKAWLVPYELSQRLGFFDFSKLEEAAPDELERSMLLPTPLHRFPNKMSKNLIATIRRISKEFGGKAGAIWAGRPPSARIVRRFLEFQGVGQKIATMAANILVRGFRIEVSDYYSIDISVDVHVMRVFARMGFVPKDSSVNYLIFRTRELNPSYPGIFDFVIWEHGRSVCKPTQPACDKCPYSHLCGYANGGDSS